MPALLCTTTAETLTCKGALAEADPADRIKPSNYASRVSWE